MEIIAVVIGLFLSSLDTNAVNTTNAPESSAQQSQQPEQGSSNYIICDDQHM